MNLNQFLQFVNLMYDENCHERREHGQKPYKNQWDYLVRNRHWLEKQYYHNSAKTWNEVVNRVSI